jgi:uncharacterized protein YqjF (DUF2071 family)
VSGRLPDARVRRPVLLNTWSDATFLHWRADPARVQALLPQGLRVDVLDGSAWLGVVAFRMSDVRLPGLPAVPGWSTFPELNVRTYVRGPDGRDGVLFLDLLCPRRAFVWALRRVGLPYRHADAWTGRTDEHATYRFTRPRGVHRQTLEARVEVGARLRAGERTPLVDALTGRWNAYSSVAGRLLRVPVDHEPWELHGARLVEARRRTTRGGLRLPVDAPLVHFSPGVHARIGAPVPAT